VSDLNKQRISVAKATRTIDWMVTKKYTLMEKWGDAIREFEEFNKLTSDLQRTRDVEYTCRICGKHLVVSLKDLMEKPTQMTHAVFEVCPECVE